MLRAAVVSAVARRSSCVVQAHESRDSCPFFVPRKLPYISELFLNDDSSVSARLRSNKDRDVQASLGGEISSTRVLRHNFQNSFSVFPIGDSLASGMF